MERISEGVQIVRWAGSVASEAEDRLAPEEPLEIRVRGRAITVTMRTPGAEGEDAELSAGFLLTEGVISKREDILAIEPCARNEWGNVVNVLLAPLVHVDFERLTRHVFASSSCGLCGKASIEAIRGNIAAVRSGVHVRAESLGAMPGHMREKQATFVQTGAVHAAGLFRPNGELVVVREDVGRHNAVDKVIGHAFLLGQIPASELVLMVSGRVSFEIVQKAAAAGIPVLAGVSAPTALAVEFAKEMGVTVAGFVRDGRMNVYAHAERIVP